ncbi:MAG: ATP-binding protein [Candidatus Magasanikbacteria bacterium]
MFNKPISQLNESDIQSLIDNKEKESLVLEFKQEITGTDHEKKEISKDISAMANADGGYLIIGIKEASSCADSITGTSKDIGRQPVEAWIENILITNIRPRISIKPQVIALTSISDRVVVVIYIPKSPRRPHMVVADGRNAYYIRHNFQAAYADEHEVRSMFLESKSMGDEMKSFLGARHLNDPLDGGFAITPLSEELSKSLILLRELPEKFNSKPFVLFASCPRYLEERVDIASADFQNWLELNKKVNLFGLDIDFLSYDKTVSADSIYSVEEIRSDEIPERLPYYYTEINRNGYLENGLGADLMWPNKDILLFNIARFTAAFWMFMKFTRSLYEKIGYSDEVNVIVALADMKGLMIHGFGNKDEKTKWAQPYDIFHSYKKPICKQRNVKIERNMMASDLNDDKIEAVVKEVAKRVSNAFGENIAKCFDDAGNFDPNLIRGFRNIH